MRQSKAYFHPNIGERLGMTIVEAMADGLIPIVPNMSGPIKFVPKKYHQYIRKLLRSYVKLFVTTIFSILYSNIFRKT